MDSQLPFRLRAEDLLSERAKKIKDEGGPPIPLRGFDTLSGQIHFAGSKPLADVGNKPNPANKIKPCPGFIVGWVERIDGLRVRAPTEIRAAGNA
ncbi:MAG: hypothetical protein GY859_36640 [Desulfobacterales bacterium]|nr:hypothetical protein [Desulfobacterales bacterium]